MTNSILSAASYRVKTPAYIFDKKTFSKYIKYLSSTLVSDFCHTLLPLKSFTIPRVLELIAPHFYGFTASSMFETQLALSVLQSKDRIHFTSPCVKDDEIERLVESCGYISSNSFSQFEKFHRISNSNCNLGIRVNTEMSFVRDQRYDPCNIRSKLGIPVSAVKKLLNSHPGLFKNVSGLLMHSNCESEDFGELLTTVKDIDSNIPVLLKQIDWINLGGGYLFDETTNWAPFEEAAHLLKSKYDLEVFFEPGKGIVGEAGYIISTVVDVFESGDKNIAILDTTVNHMPEVFEYQYKPSIMQESKTGKYRYILGGASCLAGDLFGEYSFDEPLKTGSKIVFEDMGAYTLVKAHMFNGINLPTIYLQNMDGELELIREFDYEDFLSRCGAKKHDTIRKVAFDIKAS